jgi:hypothetical protein
MKHAPSDCNLITDPSIEFSRNGPLARKKRLETLVGFLDSTKSIRSMDDDTFRIAQRTSLT